MAFENQNPTTLIHFGCVPARELFESGQDFYENAEDTHYANCVRKIDQIVNDLSEYVDEKTRAEMIQLATDNFNENYENECAPLELNRDGILILQGNQDDPDIFVILSPYYCYAPACSPCAPGAGYLMDADKIDEEPRAPYKTYCLDSSWFAKGECPYKYYEVISDEERS